MKSGEILATVILDASLSETCAGPSLGTLPASWNQDYLDEHTRSHGSKSF